MSGDTSRRGFLGGAGRAAAAVAAASLLPPSIARALAIPAARETGTINDVHHIVVLMMENRSFDHYFGSLRGVRGFGDRHAVPLASGKPVWWQSDGEREVTPFHLDTATTDALKVPGTPHSFSDSQAAWNQGRFGLWAKYKTPYSMGHFRRDDIPFQYALAEAFTICDAYHCSVTTGTDPNRIMLWSGSNFDPAARARGENCTDKNSEPNNLRCWVKGALPEPGYTYQGSAFHWPTIPDVLEAAGIDWRIYQDPNNNWDGAMHGGLAFASFRTAKPGSPIYERGMRHWSLDRLAGDAKDGTLPAVSWILPPMKWSEHPSTSTPAEGAEFTAKVLDALTANPEVWSRTAFFLMFDENDGLFDHVPPPAPPSYDATGALAGKATLDLKGMYFSDPALKYTFPSDEISRHVRPWGLGPRVPMYVISPWSKGGWVNSEVFDHSSIGQFLEKRFGITVPAISPWHRAVSGDLTSAFDFAGGPDPILPELPDASGSSRAILASLQRPKVKPPAVPQSLWQEPGVRRSRALPYVLHVDAAEMSANTVNLDFINSGTGGAVFHVYDRRNLNSIPRRYTVEAQKRLSDVWRTADDGGYDLWVVAPNGFMRSFRREAARSAAPTLELRYNLVRRAIAVRARNPGRNSIALAIRDRQYGTPHDAALEIAPGKSARYLWPLAPGHDWYDLTISGDGFEHRFAGRVETGRDGLSDPASAS